MRDTRARSEEFESLKTRPDAQRRGYEFQSFIGELFRDQHFKVEENAKSSAPRQVDLLAARGGAVYLVETKWQTTPVDVDAIDSLFTRLDTVRSTVVGILVSYSGFTRSVIDRVIEKSHRPVLLVSGPEITQVLGQSGDFIGLLQKKQTVLLRDRRVSLEEPPKRNAKARVKPKGGLPTSSKSFLLPSGKRVSSFQTSGGFGKFAFVQDLPDIDWVDGGGFGVSLDLTVPVQSQGDLFMMIQDMADMGWVTSNGSWSIKQATSNWHGFGVKSLVDSLEDWQKRYKGLEIHHTEEMCYIDEVENGYYTLTAEVSADNRRIVWRTDLSLQLTGIPLIQDPLRQLFAELGIHDNPFFRPRNRASVVRTRPDLSLVLPPVSPIAFVVNRLETTPGQHEEWVVGIVVDNPYLRSTEEKHRETSDWVPDLLEDSEHLVCALRSWHQVDSLKSQYDLWEFESSWTSNALAVRAVAEWR